MRRLFWKLVRSRSGHTGVGMVCAACAAVGGLGLGAHYLDDGTQNAGAEVCLSSPGGSAEVCPAPVTHTHPHTGVGQAGVSDMAGRLPTYDPAEAQRQDLANFDDLARRLREQRLTP